MGLFDKMLGAKSYEPGGEHYVKITDSAFERAMGELSHSDGPYAGLFKDFAAEQVVHFEIGKYEAHDFPVTHIVAEFCLAHHFQEENNGIPEELRVGYIEPGRKDTQDYQKWVEKWKDNLPSSEKGLVKGIISKGLKGMGDIDRTGVTGLTFGLAALAAKGVQLGVARVATGKSKDVRIFEKLYANYICGDSRKAKEYVISFAEKFGALDDGIMGVFESITAIFWMCEIARANRGKQ